MPSLLYNGGVGGPQLLISGNPWSGQFASHGSIFIAADPNNSGNLYLDLSGMAATVAKVYLASSGSLEGGFCLRPGGAFFIPRQTVRQFCSGLHSSASGTPHVTSGNAIDIYLQGDAASSGQALIYWDVNTPRP